MLSSVINSSLELPYTAAVEEKMKLFNPNFKHISNRILDLVTLFSKYSLGLSIDSSTLIKAARCTNASNFSFSSKLDIIFVSAMSHLIKFALLLLIFAHRRP